MNHQLLLLRAVSSEFIERKAKSITNVIGIIVVLALAGTLYLTTLNIWWWALVIPLALIILIIIILRFIVRRIVGKLRPQSVKSQTANIKGFVDKLESVVENLRTPVPIIFTIMVKDLLTKNNEPFIRKVIHDSSSLRKDYLELLKSMPKDN